MYVRVRVILTCIYPLVKVFGSSPRTPQAPPPTPTKPMEALSALAVVAQREIPPIGQEAIEKALLQADLERTRLARERAAMGGEDQAAARIREVTKARQDLEEAQDTVDASAGVMRRQQEITDELLRNNRQQQEITDDLLRNNRRYSRLSGYLRDTVNRRDEEITGHKRKIAELEGRDEYLRDTVNTRDEEITGLKRKIAELEGRD